MPTASSSTTWAGPDINGPWGNMAVVDNGTTATLFVSMAGFDVPGPQVRDPATGYPVTIEQGDRAAHRLAIPAGQAAGDQKPDRRRRRVRRSAPTGTCS